MRVVIVLVLVIGIKKKRKAKSGLAQPCIERSSISVRVRGVRIRG